MSNKLVKLGSLKGPKGDPGFNIRGEINAIADLDFMASPDNSIHPRINDAWVLNPAYDDSLSNKEEKNGAVWVYRGEGYEYPEGAITYAGGFEYVTNLRGPKGEVSQNIHFAATYNDFVTVDYYNETMKIGDAVIDNGEADFTRMGNMYKIIDISPSEDTTLQSQGKWIEATDLNQIKQNSPVIIVSINSEGQYFAMEKEADSSYEEMNENCVFLDPGIWNVDGAKFAIYYFNKDNSLNNGVKEKFEFLVKVDGSNIYYTNFEEGWTNCIFVRLHPDCEEPCWEHKWNQTADLSVPASLLDSNMLTITGWGEYENGWGKYTQETSSTRNINAINITGHISRCEDGKLCIETTRNISDLSIFFLRYLDTSTRKFSFYDTSYSNNASVYCNKANSSSDIKIGPGDENNEFIFDSNGYFKNTDTDKWIGVWDKKQWRCYTTDPLKNNIKGQSFKIFEFIPGNLLVPSNPKVTIDTDNIISINSVKPNIYYGGKNIEIVDQTTINSVGYTWDKEKKSFAAGENINTATGNWSFSEGNGTIASGDYSHAEGNSSKSTGENSHSEGYKTTAIGKSSHTEGYGVEALGLASHAEGWHDIDNSGELKYKVRQAEDDELKYNIISDFEGTTGGEDEMFYLKHGMTFFYDNKYCYVTEVIYDESNVKPIAFKLDKSFYKPNTDIEIKLLIGKSVGVGSHTEGNNTVTYGYYSHAEGNTTRAAGSNSHAEGSETASLGVSSHAEGRGTVAIGDASHAEGIYSNAEGSYSHAEGFETHAKGHSSHAEGLKTKAEGDYSHSEGTGSIAVGSASHAEGYHTQAIGSHSHAEGESSIAIGTYSHTEGFDSKAEGSASHAEGAGTHAKAIYSHTEGYNTIANNMCEHAEGEFNKSNTGTISSIGIGTNINERKNALEVMRTGDMYVYGLGDYDGTNAVDVNSEGKKGQSLQEYLEEYKLPQKENELIYFEERDENSGFVSKQLLLQDDIIIIDNQEDYNLCTDSSDVETDVLGAWQQFTEMKAYSPEYGSGQYINSSIYGYGRWYSVDSKILNPINSNDFNGYMIPFAKSSYSIESIIGTNEGNTTGDNIGFSIVNDKNAIPKHIETESGKKYYRNTLYDILPIDEEGNEIKATSTTPQRPSKSAWVSEDKVNNTAYVIYTDSPTSGNESFPTIYSEENKVEYNVYYIDNIKTSAGRKKYKVSDLEGNSVFTEKIKNTVEASGVIDFVTITVTNSSQMMIGHGASTNGDCEGTIYVYGSRYDISSNSNSWTNQLVFSGNDGDLGRLLVAYNEDLDTAVSHLDPETQNYIYKPCVIKTSTDFSNGILTVEFSDAIGVIENAKTEPYNSSELKIDFINRKYFITPRNDSDDKTVVEYDLPVSGSIDDDFWSGFAQETKFMYHAYSYQNLYIECLNILMDNKVIWVHNDGINTEYGLKSDRKGYEIKGNISTKDILSGSRLAYNSITKKLFYSNGDIIYRIASSSEGNSGGDSGSNSGIDSGSSSSQSFTLEPAKADVLGGIKVGANLSITSDGVLTAKGYSWDDETNTMTITSNSGILGKINAEGGFFETSDARKKDIQGELSLDKAYDFIRNCEPILYNLKGSNKTQIGLIAQEVREFFPEIVNEDNEGYLSLDYAKLTVIILRVLKDLIDKK